MIPPNLFYPARLSFRVEEILQNFMDMEQFKGIRSLETSFVRSIKRAPLKDRRNFYHMTLTNGAYDCTLLN